MTDDEFKHLRIFIQEQSERDEHKGRHSPPPDIENAVARRDLVNGEVGYIPDPNATLRKKP